MLYLGCGNSPRISIGYFLKVFFRPEQDLHFHTKTARKGRLCTCQIITWQIESNLLLRSKWEAADDYLDQSATTPIPYSSSLMEIPPAPRFSASPVVFAFRRRITPLLFSIVATMLPLTAVAPSADWPYVPEKSSSLSRK